MDRQHTTITAPAIFGLLGKDGVATPVPAQLRYRTQDPFAITISFAVGPGRVIEWMLDRDLLTSGITAHAGQGDIRIMPAPNQPELVFIGLNSPSGKAALRTFAIDLTEFLHRTYDLVPEGTEELWSDMDGLLAQLLADR
ncbi:MAG TPA: SsgA family sporulation/cell division regulator [Pseudonocardiaceae bacterium]|nr:SsgA family sporulation/cell division regulator [Pseudonocardiaceae bacterium]